MRRWAQGIELMSSGLMQVPLPEESSCWSSQVLYTGLSVVNFCVDPCLLKKHLFLVHSKFCSLNVKCAL